MDSLLNMNQKTSQKSRTASIEVTGTQAFDILSGLAHLQAATQKKINIVRRRLEKIPPYDSVRIQYAELCIEEETKRLERYEKIYTKVLAASDEVEVSSD